MEISFSTKMKIFFSTMLASLMSFYEPVIGMLMPILWLVIIDILTGMYAIRIVEKQPLTSRGFLKKFPQIIMFLVAVAAALHADPFFIQFGIEKFQSSKWVTSFYGLYELFSILENLGKSGLPVAKQFANILQAKLPEEIKKELPKDPE